MFKKIAFGDFINDLQQTLQKFWLHHPALLYGLFLFFGTLLALYTTWIFFIIFALFCFLFSGIKGGENFNSNHLRFLLAFILFLSSFCFTRNHYLHPLEEKIKGTGLIEFSSVALIKTHFGSFWSYKGTLHSFVNSDKNISAKNLPITLSLPYEKYPERPSATHVYALEGILKNQKGKFTFLIPKKDSWKSVKKSWNLSEIRYEWKKRFQNYIQGVINDRSR